MNPDSQNSSDPKAIIRLRNVSKIFPVERTSATLFKALKKGVVDRFQQPGTFSALSDLNFDVLKGERIGIVGDNGSGKTTLLKIVAGLHRISDGQLDVHGRVTLVASLGIGMMEELTVAENIFLYGAIYGLGRRTMGQRQAEILEWAELEGFAQSRLKTLSSGMKTRLAFSALRHIEEDIYLLDEVLTAGDKNFMHKCEQVFAGYKNTQKTFLVTTHDLNFVRTFCEKTLWLHKGCQMGFGRTEEIVDQYVEARLI